MYESSGRPFFGRMLVACLDMNVVGGDFLDFLDMNVVGGC